MKKYLLVVGIALVSFGFGTQITRHESIKAEYTFSVSEVCNILCQHIVAERAEQGPVFKHGEPFNVELRWKGDNGIDYVWRSDVDKDTTNIVLTYTSK